MTPDQSDRARTLSRIFTISQLAAAGLLVLFIAGSLVFVGGRVSSLQSEAWPALWDWPVFPVPGWLLVALAAVGAAVVVPMSVLTPPAHAPRLLGGIGQAFAAGCSAVLFSGLFPATEGLIPMPTEDGTYLGPHWIAAVLSLFSMVVLIIAIVFKYGEYERLRKSGALIP